MDKLRWPAFLVACLAVLMVVGLELGTNWLAPAKAPMSSIDGSETQSDQILRTELASVGMTLEDAKSRAAEERPPGSAIPRLALLDALLLFTVAMMAAPLIWTARIHGRLQGVVTLLFSILVLLGGFKLILTSLAELQLMVGLVVAVPFGMVAYLLRWGYFDVGGAATVLSALLILKFIFVIALIVAHQRFLQNKGLMLLVGCSFLAHLAVKILHGFVPLPFVSITDALGGVIILAIVLIWAFFFLIGSIPAVIKAVI